MLIVAPLLAGACAGVGVFASYYLDASPGGVVVLTMGVVFALVYVFSPHQGLLGRRRSRRSRTLEGTSA